MSKNQQHALFSATRRLLRPLVRILLRNGVAHGAFAELTKKVFVDVAFDEFAPDGKKQTVSRVSAMTGLTRKEVARLHELQQTDDTSSQARYNRAVRVISGWMNDTRFHDSAGKPAELPVSGQPHSFDELVRQYSGDIPTRAMLSMLVESGSVEELDGKVRLIRFAYQANPRDRWAGLTLADDMLATLPQALQRGMDQRQALQAIIDVRPDHIEALRALWHLAEQRGDQVAAQTYLQRLHRLSPLDREARDRVH